MIKKEEVQHIAKLSRIKLSQQELKRFQGDLSSILDYFNSLKEVDVSEIEPTFHPAEYFFGKSLGKMRKDKAESQPSEVVNKLIEAAPDKKKRHISVKAIF